MVASSGRPFLPSLPDHIGFDAISLRERLRRFSRWKIIEDLWDASADRKAAENA
jgi:hypothetical protein